MCPLPHQIDDVPTLVKNPDLVERRRLQIVDVAVRLFIEKGFHKTTTREIARAAGFSIGTLYEYVASKEDVLYLVCEAIHAEVEQSVAEVLKGSSGGIKALGDMIREYFLVCDRMSDHILLMYQETKCLPSQRQSRVLANEIRITGLFKEALSGILFGQSRHKPDAAALELIAHNIIVMGHMWTFRRWFFRGNISLDDYYAPDRVGFKRID